MANIEFLMIQIRDKMTIFGESAGNASVTYHLITILVFTISLFSSKSNILTEDDVFQQLHNISVI